MSEHMYSLIKEEKCGFIKAWANGVALEAAAAMSAAH
jgi:hypothetical protein